MKFMHTNCLSESVMHLDAPVMLDVNADVRIQNSVD